ncbi:5137_t:CDS:1, partial [Funneliformis geosporum]
NPKYYLDTEENRNSRHFVRKDMLGPHDIKSIESHSRLTSDWWYKHKAWVDKFAIFQFYKFRQNKNIV